MNHISTPKKSTRHPLLFTLYVLIAVFILLVTSIAGFVVVYSAPLAVFVVKVDLTKTQKKFFYRVQKTLFAPDKSDDTDRNKKKLRRSFFR